MNFFVNIKDILFAQYYQLNINYVRDLICDVTHCSRPTKLCYGSQCY